VLDSLIWAWTFSDGQRSSAQTPLLRFSAGSLTAHLQATDAFGCKDTISSTVAIYDFPVIKGPPEISIPVGFPVTLPFTYSTGIISWAWTPSANLSCDDCANPVASPIFSTLYSVSVTDSNNCTSRDSIRVTTICNANNYFIPNTFSPNNDGVNDFFYPRGKSLYNIQSMRVFNRWGQMVFERKDFPANAAASGWDGTFNGHPAPADVYVYIVEVVCDNAQVIPLKGDITLIR
jgi:gliding motility-associated-like protein